MSRGAVNGPLSVLVGHLSLLARQRLHDDRTPAVRASCFVGVPLVRCPSARGLAEEAPFAYKDVDRVVRVVERVGLAAEEARERSPGLAHVRSRDGVLVAFDRARIDSARSASVTLASERGPFPAWREGDAAVPDDVGQAFVTAAEVAPHWHLEIQSAFQRHVDAAVSKTVNLPRDATVDDIAEICLNAWRRRAKGVTVYGYGSRPGQVLTFLSESTDRGRGVRVAADYAGGCAGHACEF